MIGESQDTLKEEREFERTIFKEYRRFFSSNFYPIKRKENFRKICDKSTLVSSQFRTEKYF